MYFYDPQIVLFVDDCEAAAEFYATFGFEETFRTSPQTPVKIEMALGSFSLGLALPEPAAESHGISPISTGHRACITLWTDDVDSAYRVALDAGAQHLREPHEFLNGHVRVAFVVAPDKHPVQFVERLPRPEGSK